MTGLYLKSYGIKLFFTMFVSVVRLSVSWWRVIKRSSSAITWVIKRSSCAINWVAKRSSSVVTWVITLSLGSSHGSLWGHHLGGLWVRKCKNFISYRQLPDPPLHQIYHHLIFQLNCCSHRWAATVSSANPPHPCHNSPRMPSPTFPTDTLRGHKLPSSGQKNQREKQCEFSTSGGSSTV